MLGIFPTDVIKTIIIDFNEKEWQRCIITSRKTPDLLTPIIKLGSDRMPVKYFVQWYLLYPSFMGLKKLDISHANYVISLSHNFKSFQTLAFALDEFIFDRNFFRVCQEKLFMPALRTLKVVSPCSIAKLQKHIICPTLQILDADITKVCFVSDEFGAKTIHHIGNISGVWIRDREWEDFWTSLPNVHSTGYRICTKLTPNKEFFDVIPPGVAITFIKSRQCEQRCVEYLLSYRMNKAITSIVITEKKNENF